MSGFYQTSWFLAAWFVALLAWDVYARLCHGVGSTVSYVVQYWAAQEPATVVVVWFLLGHVYWPQWKGNP